MKKQLLFFLTVILFSLSGFSQTIISLSEDTLSKSGRLIISGNNFGDTEKVVKIGGVTAPISSWSSTSITAYVPETISTGSASVKVITDAGASNSISIVVTNRISVGRVQWRFKADDLYIQGRPAVGPDNTVYALGIGGHLYALTPDGGLKWIFKVPVGSVQSVSVDNNGTIYFAGGNTIYAVNPNGTLKWSVVDQSGAQVDVGPNVGPNGNIYAVTDDAGNGGFGLIAISPQGEILWTHPGFIHGYGEAFSTKEMVFGSGQLYFVMNDVDGIHLGLQAYTLNGDFRWSVIASGQPAVSPHGRIYAKVYYLSAFSPNGDLIQDYPNVGPTLTAPDVGPDEIVYVGSDPDLYALRPNGDTKWVVEESGFLKGPIVSPTNKIVVVSGYDVAEPGYVSGVSTSGQQKWIVNLPAENGGYVRAMSRARFSGNGNSVYIGMDVNDYATDAYTYLYAIKAVNNFMAEGDKENEMSDRMADSNFDVYPDPAQNEIHIKTKREGVFTLMELSGRILMTTNIESERTINIEHLPAGIYVIKAIETGEIKKVMVDH